MTAELKNEIDRLMRLTYGHVSEGIIRMIAEDNLARAQGPNLMPIVDAAVDVSVFAKNHDFPQPLTSEFFEFTDKLHKLEVAIRAAYPNAVFFKGGQPK